MAKPQPSWSRAITGPADLLTSPEAIRAGFFEQAEAKIGKAIPFVVRSRQLRLTLRDIGNVDSLIEAPAIFDEIILAAGISQKARNYFTPPELKDAVARVIRGVYNDCVTLHGSEGSDAVYAAFCDEVVAQYLLTSGATLDGQMRNWTGAHAQERFVAALLEALDRRGKQTEYAEADTGEAESGEAETAADDSHEDVIPDAATADPSPKIKRSMLAWPGRLLLFNVTPKPVWNGVILELNNIDMVLLDADASMSELTLKQDATKYLACGELKGGIDPAGADEHRKTARSALDRIRSKFTSAGLPSPQLFFVGAVIVNKMAREIYERLEDNALSYAVNLTNEAQLAMCADWLVSP